LGVDYKLRIKDEHLIVEEFRYAVDDLIQCLLRCMGLGHEGLVHIIDRKRNYTQKRENSECTQI